jgi:large conductance mechanosensitive channel
MKNLLLEFKKFAMRGNVLDLAVAVVVGGAFGKIVSSLTDEIIMPIIGVLTGGIDFSDFAWTLKKATADTEAVTVNYGIFVNSIITFTIVAFAIFMVVKVMNKFQNQKEAEPKKEQPPTKEEVLLAEIRDILKTTAEVK